MCVPVFLNNTVSVLSEYNETLLRFRPKNEKRPSSTKKALEVRIEVKIEHWSLYPMFGTDFPSRQGSLGGREKKKNFYMTQNIKSKGIFSFIIIYIRISICVEREKIEWHPKWDCTQRTKELQHSGVEFYQVVDSKLVLN